VLILYIQHTFARPDKINFREKGRIEGTWNGICEELEVKTEKGISPSFAICEGEVVVPIHW
jgi:hypothetical protein